MRVYAVSAGMVPVGKHPELDIDELMVRSSIEALDKVQELRPDRIIVGNMFSGVSSHQEHLGALLASSLGYSGIPAYKVEASCGSGGVSIHNAYIAIKSGESDAVLVTGVEKMTNLSIPQVTSALVMADSNRYTASVGATFISLNAITHRLYTKRYGVEREDMASFPVISHKNAIHSPHAMFHKEIKKEDVISSPIVSDPIRLLDSSPVCDGAASIMLVSENRLSKLPTQPVEIIASEVAVNLFSIYEREDPLIYDATRVAFRKAMQKSDLDVDKIDFIELHDAFSVTAALSLESMGVSEKGRAPADASNGRFELHGEMPINTFGGLKARGHPVGATGVYQAAEAYLQLTDAAGKNQVNDARIGVIHNMGGVDTTTAVHIMRRVN
ncbi:MAG: beta-ketoacyl synthase N-terminal-like domain-containing protein [Conexivisphaerales archaeon]